MKCLRFVTIFLILVNFIPSTFANEDLNINSSLFQGYISNKVYRPLKLKIFEIDKNSTFLIERNLEDGSYIPLLNLNVTAETPFDYYLEDQNIFIPAETRLNGYISEIEPPKSFNRRGFYKVTFNSATCPNGDTIYLRSNILSKSQSTIYNPLHHLGKTTLSLLGGGLAGTLLTYELGGLGLSIATHGYSLAAGAAAGGFIGTVGGIASKGKKATIEPGQDIIVSPVDETSLEELKQISCKKSEENKIEEVQNPNIDVKIIEIKKRKDILGDNSFKIEILFANKSLEYYRLSNFFLQDSQGKEYTTSFIDLNDDFFIDFPPQSTKEATLEFFVDYPKASHWLVLKDKNFNGELGKWKIN